jgi:hypothetical protein
MTNVLVLYYSSYGHIETMAVAQAEGAARVPNTRVAVKRVPELVPADIAGASGFRLEQPAPVAVPEELEQYEAIIFGTPTRFGNMASQMRNFLASDAPSREPGIAPCRGRGPLTGITRTDRSDQLAAANLTGSLAGPCPIVVIQGSGSPAGSKLSICSATAPNSASASSPARIRPTHECTP